MQPKVNVHTTVGLLDSSTSAAGKQHNPMQISRDSSLRVESPLRTRFLIAYRRLSDKVTSSSDLDCSPTRGIFVTVTSKGLQTTVRG